MSTKSLRKIANNIIKNTLKAVDPHQSVNTHLSRQDNTLTCADQTYELSDYKRIRIIGFGKGSAPMAQAVQALLADKITDGLVIVKYGHTLDSNIDLGPIKIVEAGHPVPDENGLSYSKQLLTMLEDSTAQDLVICLVSGGGSALLVQPVAGVSLTAMQDLTKLLLGAGATINQMNTIRKHLSQVKGGWLAQHLYPATTINLILSDVGGDPLDIIASGPTVPDSGTFAESIALLKEYELLEKIPPEIRQYLRAGVEGHQPETPKPGHPAFAKVQNQIIANNGVALSAAVATAKANGLHVIQSDTFLEGEAREVARLLVDKACELAEGHQPKPCAFIIGGETTVTLKGDGLGGRNQEMALAAAIQLQNQENMLIACFATDGNDGPTDATGAIANGKTVLKGEKLGLKAAEYLENNDSYHYFEAIDDLIITGPTNTNVNDLALVLVA